MKITKIQEEGQMVVGLEDINLHQAQIANQTAKLLQVKKHLQVIKVVKVRVINNNKVHQIIQVHTNLNQLIFIQIPL
jgi:hypothetical protein